MKTLAAIIGWIKEFDRFSYERWIAVSIGSVFLEVEIAKMLHLREATGFSLLVCLVFVSVFPILYSLYFFLIRFKLPRAKNQMLGIYIVYQCETSKQKTSFENELIDELRSIIRTEGLSDTLQVISVPAHFYRKFIDPDWVRVKYNSTNGQFFLCATVKQFTNEKGSLSYSTKFRSAVIHKEFANDADQKLFQGELNSAMPLNEVIFPEGFTKGFEMTARIVHLTATYIIGRAAFIDGGEKGLHIHERMIIDDVPGLQQFRSFKSLMPVIINHERIVLAQRACQNFAFDKAEKLVDKILLQDSLNWGAWLLSGILKFQAGDIEAAIQSTKKAEKISTKARTARYNLAFLYLWKGEYKQAFRWMKKIQRSSSSRDSMILGEIFEFCETRNLVERNVDVNYWLAFLSFHKLQDKQKAKTYLYSYLNSRTDSTESELSFAVDGLLSEIDKAL